jgi:hypothetical protein
VVLSNEKKFLELEPRVFSNFKKNLELGPEVLLKSRNQTTLV